MNLNLQQTKNPASAATEQGSDQKNQPANHTHVPKKWQRVLAAFLSGRSFNRFEAERQLHDHALHSTVSTLQNMGLVIDRAMEAVPGYMGATTHVMRYRLSPASIESAKVLLGINECHGVSPCA